MILKFWKKEAKKYKRAVLYMTDAYLAKILMHISSRDKYRYQVIDHALPEDVKVIRTFQSDAHQGMLGLLLESETFPETEDGNLYPELPPPIIRQEYVIEDDFNA